MDLEVDGSSRESSLGDYNNHVSTANPAVVDDVLIQNNGSCSHDDDGDAFNLRSNGKASQNSNAPLEEESGEKHANAEPQAHPGSPIESHHLGSGKFAVASVGIEAEEHAGVSPGIRASSPPGNSSDKGKGLRKWRRIKRGHTKDGSPNPDYGKNLKRGLDGSEMKEESKGSLSSVKANNAGGVGGLPTPGMESVHRLKLENSTFNASTDSDNSEDRGSKSSTAGSVARRMQQGKGLVGATKKPRGGRVKIEKTNTLYNLESDCQSSNSVNSNARQSRIPVNHEEEQGDDTLASGQQSVEDLPAALSESVGEAEDISQSDARSPCETKRRSHSPSISGDPLVDSVIMLQSAKDALEREIGKFGEIGRGLNFFCEESCKTMDLEIQLEEVRGILKEKEKKIVVLEAIMDAKNNGLGGAVELQEAQEIDVELEDLFKHRIEAEVEHLAITRATGSWITVAKNLIKILDEQRAIGDAERKAAALKSQAEEVFKMQKRVARLAACFLMQLILLVLVIGLFFFHLPSNSTEITPT
ncbi:hypothetical protein Dimus_014416 [Dionaea muscipula]